MATQSTVTGPVQTPFGATPDRGYIRFQLTDWDSESGTVITTSKVEEPISVSTQSFSASLWASSEGDRGVNYKVTAVWYYATSDKWVEDEIGYCEVGTSGPYALADILVDDPIYPADIDYATAAATSAAEAAASASRNAPYGSRSELSSSDVPAAVISTSFLGSDGVTLMTVTEDASATNPCVTSNSGTRKWVPSGTITPDHFGENSAPGTTDMTTAIQAWADYLAATGAVGHLASTTYRLTAPITLPEPVRFKGVRPGPISSIYTGTDVPSEKGNGTWLHFDHSGKGLVVGGDVGVVANERLTGYSVTDFGTFRTHSEDTGSGWTPTVYDWDIYISSADYAFPSDSVFSGICLLNAYNGIGMERDGSATLGSSVRILFRDIFGQPFNIGIEDDFSTDVCRFENIQFWPYWDNGTEVLAWTQANGTGFRFGRVDRHMMLQCFAYGYGTPFHLFQSTEGATTLTAVNCGGDNVGSYGWLIESDDAWLDLVACTTWGGTNGIKVTGDDSVVKITAGRIRDTSASSISINGTGNVIDLVSPQLVDSAPAANYVYSDAGNTVKVSSPPLFSQVGKSAKTVPNYGGGTYEGAQDRRVTGRYAGTTDASGYVAIPHGFLTTPAFAMATYDAAGSANIGRQVCVYSKDATNVTFAVTNATGGALASTSVAFYWSAELFA